MRTSGLGRKGPTAPVRRRSLPRSDTIVEPGDRGESRKGSQRDCRLSGTSVLGAPRAPVLDLLFTDFVASFRADTDTDKLADDFRHVTYRV